MTTTQGTLQMQRLVLSKQSFRNLQNIHAQESSKVHMRECVEHRSIAWDVLGVQYIFVCLNGWVNVWVRVAGPLGWFVPSSCSIIFRSLVTWALGPQVLWIEEITLVFCGWWWLIYMSTIYVLWAQRCAFIQFSSLLDTHIFHFASQTLTPSSERLYKVAALALEMTGKYIPMWILAYF